MTFQFKLFISKMKLSDLRVGICHRINNLKSRALKLIIMRLLTSTTNLKRGTDFD